MPKKTITSDTEPKTRGPARLSDIIPANRQPICLAELPDADSRTKEEHELAAFFAERELNAKRKVNSLLSSPGLYSGRHNMGRTHVQNSSMLRT